MTYAAEDYRREAAALRLDGQQTLVVMLEDAAERLERETWQPIETAPKDGTLFLAWAPGAHWLPSMYSLCSWQHDAGFCIDELRDPTHWRPLPAPPQEPR